MCSWPEETTGRCWRPAGRSAGAASRSWRSECHRERWWPLPGSLGRTSWGEDRARTVFPAHTSSFFSTSCAVTRSSSWFLILDRTLLACDRHRQAIETEARLAAPPSHAVRNVNDKRLNLETARRLGIPCPDQFELTRLEDVPSLVDRLQFPMVLKDPGPTADGQPSPFDFTWLVARDMRELTRYLDEPRRSGCVPDVSALRHRRGAKRVLLRRRRGARRRPLSTETFDGWAVCRSFGR